ncbi:MAG: hypothetical protein H6817_09920, partial [Phycisphaerales bacterium]|nr:hypothetical protein [Phycisphaerales bacterium]
MSDTAHEKLADESQGKCLYCAYDLTGIPDDANCPECGRQNIPTAFRREVQDIFDSPLRLYREAFRIIGKHPPGWYWSLDRPGDVARSFRLAILNIVLCFVILGGAWIAANAYVVRVTEDTYYVLTGTTAPVHAYVDIVDVGPFGSFTEFLSTNYLDENQLPNAIVVRTKTSVTRERRFRGFTVESSEPLISPAMLLTAIWMTITQLGMWT